MASLWDGLTKVNQKRRLDQAIATLDGVSDRLDAWARDDAVQPRSGAERLLSLGELRNTFSFVPQKELGAAATKLGKAADRMSGAGAGRTPLGLTFAASLATEAICQHLLVSGRFEGAQHVGAPSTPSSSLESALREMNAVRSALHRDDEMPLLEWLASHRHRLGASAEELTLEIRELQYARLVHAGETRAAIELLREHFGAASAPPAVTPMPDVTDSSEAEREGVGIGHQPGATPIPAVPCSRWVRCVAASSPATGATPRQAPSLLAACGTGRCPSSAVSTSAFGHARATPKAVRLRRLAGALACVGAPGCASRHLDVPALRGRVEERMVAMGLRLVEMPSRSALVTCVEAGSLALPKLTKLAVRACARAPNHECTHARAYGRSARFSHTRHTHWGVMRCTRTSPATSSGDYNVHVATRCHALPRAATA